MEDSPIATRLKAIIESLGLTDSQFADTCAISRPTLSLLLAGKNKKISDVMLSQIHHAFPKVSILWLLFGEGEMYESPSNGSVSQSEESENPFFRSDGNTDEEQLNLVSLKHLENIIQSVVNKSVESSTDKIRDLVLKIEQPQNPRKVNKITVYYDDSTFETFIPEK